MKIENNVAPTISPNIKNGLNHQGSYAIKATEANTEKFHSILSRNKVPQKSPHNISAVKNTLMPDIINQINSRNPVTRIVNSQTDALLKHKQNRQLKGQMSSSSNGQVVSITAINSDGSRIKNNASDGTDKNFIVEFVTEGKVSKFRISIPKKSPPESGYPVMLWNHGTRGVSTVGDNDSRLSSSNKKMMMSNYDKGFIVIEPDYIQSGNNAKASGGSNDIPMTVLNALKTVIDYPDVAVDLNNIVLSGYSQGGYVSMKILEMAEAYMPSIQFKEAHLWAPGSDALAHLKNVMHHYVSNGNHHAQMWIAVLNLYNIAEAEGNIELFNSIFVDSDTKDYTDIKNHNGNYYNNTDEGRAWNNNIHFSAQFLERARSNNWTGSKWGEYFNKGIVDNFTTNTPIIMASGKDDNLVGLPEMRNLETRLRNNKNKVTRLEFEGGHHILHKANLNMYHSYLQGLFKKL